MCADVARRYSFLKINGKMMSLLRAVISVILDIKVGHFEVAVCVLLNWPILFLQERGLDK